MVDLSLIFLTRCINTILGYYINGGYMTNGITFQQIEDLNAEEAAQMKRYINNRLTAKRMAEGQRKEELGVNEDDIDSN